MTLTVCYTWTTLLIGHGMLVGFGWLYLNTYLCKRNNFWTSTRKLWPHVTFAYNTISKYCVFWCIETSFQTKKKIKKIQQSNRHNSSLGVHLTVVWCCSERHMNGIWQWKGGLRYVIWDGMCSALILGEKTWRHRMQVDTCSIATFPSVLHSTVLVAQKPWLWRQLSFSDALSRQLLPISIPAISHLPFFPIPSSSNSSRPLLSFQAITPCLGTSQPPLKDKPSPVEVRFSSAFVTALKIV